MGEDAGFLEVILELLHDCVHRAIVIIIPYGTGFLLGTLFLCNKATVTMLTREFHPEIPHLNT